MHDPNKPIRQGTSFCNVLSLYSKVVYELFLCETFQRYPKSQHITVPTPNNRDIRCKLLLITQLGRRAVSVSLFQVSLTISTVSALYFVDSFTLEDKYLNN